MLVGWLGIRLMGSIWLWIAAVARDTLLPLSPPSLALPCWQDFSEAKGGRRREVMDGWVDGEPDTGLSLLRINCFARVKRFQTAKTQAGAPLPSDGTQNRERRVKPQKARQFLVFNSNTSSRELTQAKMELTLHNETRWGEGLQSLNIDWKIEKLWKKSLKTILSYKRSPSVLKIARFRLVNTSMGRQNLLCWKNEVGQNYNWLQISSVLSRLVNSRLFVKKITDFKAHFHILWIIDCLSFFVAFHTLFGTWCSDQDLLTISPSLELWESDTLQVSWIIEEVLMKYPLNRERATCPGSPNDGWGDKSSS